VKTVARVTYIVLNMPYKFHIQNNTKFRKYIGFQSYIGAVLGCIFDFF